MADVYYKIDGSTIYYSNDNLEGYTLRPDGAKLSDGKYIDFDLDGNTEFYLPSDCSYLCYGALNEDGLSDAYRFVGSNITSTVGMFENCKNLKWVNFYSYVDLRNCTNMSKMFCECNSLVSLNWDVSNTTSVTNISYIFKDCKVLPDNDSVSSLNVSNVTDFEGAFYGCQAITELDLSGWSTSKATNMMYLFYGCSSLQSIDLSSFETSSVTNLSAMFSNCTSLMSLDVSNFDTSNVAGMSSIFENLTVSKLDLSSWNTLKIFDASRMFNGCANLTTITVDPNIFITTGFMGSGDMFLGCTSLIGEAGTIYDPTKTNREYARVDNPPDEPGYFTSIYGWKECIVYTKINGVWKVLEVYM